MSFLPFSRTCIFSSDFLPILPSPSVIFSHQTFSASQFLFRLTFSISDLLHLLSSPLHVVGSFPSKLPSINCKRMNFYLWLMPKSVKSEYFIFHHLEESFTSRSNESLEKNLPPSFFWENKIYFYQKI